MSQVIVLGWDALDLELLEEYGLSGRFGKHERKIETYVNPFIGDPHTKELWPSMITGLHPDEHGIHAATEGDGVNWDSKTLRIAASITEGVIPGDLKTYIGNMLRRQGIGLEVTEKEYYSDLPTVFDAGGKAISIPNYQTESDRKHGFDAHRDEMWKELQIDWNIEKQGMKPSVDSAKLHDILGREIGRRISHTIQAMQSGEPIVWTWFGILDTVGHMAPALGDELVEQYYYYAAHATALLHEVAGEDTIILSVSDHGLQDGTHEHYATLCSDSESAVESIESVFDISGWIVNQDTNAKLKCNDVAGSELANVEENLKELGYI